jgi:hypothetical protein
MDVRKWSYLNWDRKGKCLSLQQEAKTSITVIPHFDVRKTGLAVKESFQCLRAYKQLDPNPGPSTPRASMSAMWQYFPKGGPRWAISASPGNL